MRFHCVGVGSIGAFVSFHLRRANPAPSHAFTLLVRPQAARRTAAWPGESDGICVESNRIRRKIGGFEIEALNNTSTQFSLLPVYSGTEAATKPRPSHLPTLPIFSALKSRPAPSPISSLIVTNKAPTTKSAIEELKSRLDASSTIVLLQNGMGVYEHLIQDVFPDPDTRPNFIIASTTHGVWSKRRFDVVHASQGTITFAIVPDPLKRRDFEARTPNSKDLDPSAISVAKFMEDDPKFFSLAETVKAFLRSRDLRVHWTKKSEMDVVVRRKLAANACIGPLTALLHCQNGALFGNAAAHRTFRSVCYEAAEVFTAEAEEMQSTEGSGEVDRTWPTALSGRALEQFAAQVVQDTAKNWSSMHQDIKNNKFTEIEYINGYLSRTGARLGVATPVNDMLADMIRLRRQIPISTFNN